LESGFSHHQRPARSSSPGFTARVQGATKGVKPGKEFNDKRKAAMAGIEKECAAGNDKLRCDVVELYHGGQYSLYRYKRFQDVRLVFAPEFAIAFFGGDPDNFNFPRYDLDVSFTRVYENGQPATTEDFFKWSARGAREDQAKADEQNCPDARAADHPFGFPRRNRNAES